MSDSQSQLSFEPIIELVIISNILSCEILTLSFVVFAASIRESLFSLETATKNDQFLG